MKKSFKSIANNYSHKKIALSHLLFFLIFSICIYGGTKYTYIRIEFPSSNDYYYNLYELVTYKI